MSKIKVAILGATGTVGQKFITLLEDHPYFSVSELVASKRSAGKMYREACQWKQEQPVPESVSSKVVQNLYCDLDSPLVFSGLDASVAGEAEQYYAEKGHYVISNSKNHRMDDTVPILLPEINAQHLESLSQQKTTGKIITNSNCSTMFLAMVLGALHKQYPVKTVFVTTMQAISGSGYPGVASLDILGNIVPYISGEEEKIETELKKMLGQWNGNAFIPEDLQISASCNRVPVVDGHLASVHVGFSSRAVPNLQEVIEFLRQYRSVPQDLALPSAPPYPLIVLDEADRPQPRQDAMRERGMAAVIGRIRPCPVLDLRMSVLGHNTIRGAAGAAILNAELLYRKDYFSKLPTY